MRVIPWSLLIGCLISGCSNQQSKDASQQAAEAKSPIAPTLLDLPDLDDWPKGGHVTGFGYHMPDMEEYWSTRYRNATEDHFPFSKPF